MRIALVSPYSWTFPGGVTRHIEELAARTDRPGPPRSRTRPGRPGRPAHRALHRRAPRAGRAARPPDPARPDGRASVNGSVSNLASFRRATIACGTSCAPGASTSCTSTSRSRRWSGGTPAASTAPRSSGRSTPTRRSGFRTRSRTLIGARRVFNKLHARIAVSEAARWTGERYFGGHYDVIPNGVDTRRRAARAQGAARRVSRPVRRPRRRAQGPARAAVGFRGPARARAGALQLVGASTEAVEPFVAELNGGTEDVEFLGSVDNDELWRRLHAADVLCAPSLGGESFGMVLIEAFAAGTPVVASDIAGYRQVVTPRPRRPARSSRAAARAGRGAAVAVARSARRQRDGRGGPRAGGGLRLAACCRSRHRCLRAGDRGAAAAGARRAGRASRLGCGRRTCRRAGRRAGCASLEPRAARAALAPARVGRAARRLGLALSALIGVLLACLALQHVDVDASSRRSCDSSPSWVLVALGAVLSFDGAARGLLARHREGGAARPPCQRRVILSGTVDRRTDVGDASGPPRRAVACADRRAPARPHARNAAGRGRHAGLADAPQRVRTAAAGRAGREHDDVFRGHEVALAWSGGPGRRSSRPCWSARRCWSRAAAGCARRHAGAADRGAPRRCCGCARAWRSSAPRASRPGRSAPSSPPGGFSCSAPTRSCSRSTSTPRRHRRRRGGAVRRQRDRGPAGDPVERRRLPVRCRDGADGRLRRPGRGRARLRNHPPGGRARDRRRCSACRR